MPLPVSNSSSVDTSNTNVTTGKDSWVRIESCKVLVEGRGLAILITALKALHPDGALEVIYDPKMYLLLNTEINS